MKKLVLTSLLAFCNFTYAYDDAGEFSEGLVSVSENGKWGFIDKAGKLVIPIQYDDAGIFKEGLAAVSKTEKDGFLGQYGFINKEGKIIIPIQYNVVANFSEGLAPVCKDDSKCGFIDKEGKIIIPIQYDGVAPFNSGLALVEKDGKDSFIDKTGKEIIPAKNNYSYNSFHEGLAEVVDSDKFLSGYMDTSGKIVIDFKYAPDIKYAPGEGPGSLAYFQEDLAIVSLNGKSAYIDKNGKVILPLNYDFGCPFSEGLATVGNYDNYLHGVMDKEGKIVIQPQYDYLGEFKEGIAKFRKGKKLGFIDKNNNTVLMISENYQDNSHCICDLCFE